MTGWKLDVFGIFDRIQISGMTKEQQNHHLKQNKKQTQNLRNVNQSPNTLSLSISHKHSLP